MIGWFGLPFIYRQLEKKGITGWRAVLTAWAIIAAVVVVLVVIYD